MKMTLVIFLVVGLALPGFGQGRDTVFAVHKLFREQRGTSKSLSDSASYAAVEARYQRAHRSPTAQESRQDALFNTALQVASGLKDTRYSTENEAYVLRLYAAGQPIPPDIRRKLRRKHFHRSAQDVTAGY